MTDLPQDLPEPTLGDEDVLRLFERALEVMHGSRWEADYHETAADSWSTVHYALGLPIVVLSAVAGTSALADFDRSNIVAGLLALIVAVLSALVTFLNPQKTSELHRAARASWQTLAFDALGLSRDLDPGLPEAEFRDALHAIEDERSKLIRESPSYSRRVRRRVEKRMRAEAESEQARARAEEDLKRRGS